MNQESVINQVVEEVKKCNHNDYCPIKLINGLEYCSIESMPMCQTARFFMKYGSDYYVLKAIKITEEDGGYSDMDILLLT